ncbi:M23 family metallopeptidase [Lacinutrix iliipiscaria]|uniref:M23 family metallopeptidase n=1 Tax=Lacinutrix iliipiscaria TaxID=1230532 RepID=A0ABW5WNE5_9FLAO
MRVYVVIILAFLNFITAFSQVNVKTYYENIERGSVLYADNNELSPISIKIKLNLKNMTSSEGNEKIFVLPPLTKHYKLTTLTRIDMKKKYYVRGATWFNYGNHFLKKYDTDFEYCLPFQKGEAYTLSQGYNGKISHENKYQLDFAMPIGTKIVAAREGLVIKVVDVYNKQCSMQLCEKFNNYIYVYHKDGTFAEYVHIKRKGAKVKVGDQVKKGQVIAESGNVGWSTGPHLHFSVFLQRLGGEREFVKTKFKLKDGKMSDYLVESEKYKRLYD